jgi:hypothetical protein
VPLLTVRISQKENALLAERSKNNDAWQAAVALHMSDCVIGHDPRAFSRLGGACDDPAYSS